jgi:hypothetical protein
MEEIRNKVQESGIITLDLAVLKPKCSIIGVDIADQLWQGMVLKEKDFRSWIKTTDWKAYSNKGVFVHCSADAIIPTWAYMLIASELLTVESDFVIGSRSDLERQLVLKAISEIDIEPFKDARLIIKGCSDISAPAFAMTELMKKLQPHVRSLMYGEPCSAVPVFKRK